jgi:hypothetical protein
LAGSGESTPFVSEKFIVDERVGKRANRERHKWLVCAPTQLVNGVRHNALACAVFAGDEHRRGDSGNLVDHIANAVHRLAVT